MELQVIENKIHELRGYKIMLDFDLAEMYGLENKRLKEAVRRNIERFPTDFMFELTREEYNSLRSQFASLDIGRGKYSKYLPFAFTEHGVSMLSSVLNSKQAVQVNISIICAFVAMRQLVLNPPVDNVAQLQQEFKELKQYIEEVFTDYNDINDDTRMQIELINETLAELQVKNKELNKPRNPIGYTSDQYKKGFE